MKKIYCIERSFEYEETGETQELDNAVDILIYASTQTQNYKLLESLLNVILSAT